MISQPFVRKLSEWSTKTQTLQPTMGLIVSLMSDPFEAVEELSVLGQMLLITTCPEADFSFA